MRGFVEITTWTRDSFFDSNEHNTFTDKISVVIRSLGPPKPPVSISSLDIPSVAVCCGWHASATTRYRVVEAAAVLRVGLAG